jgi:hypothetical protein
MHIMHNLWSPRSTACMKCRTRQSDRPLKSFHIDHLLWNHGYGLTFLRGTLTDHFFPVYRIGKIAMIGVDQLCSRRKPIGGPIGARIGCIGPIRARNCADRLSQFLRMQMCTHAQNGLADSLKQTAYMLFHGRHCRTPMRRESSAELFLLLHIASNYSAHCTKKSKSCA